MSKRRRAFVVIAVSTLAAFAAVNLVCWALIENHEYAGMRRSVVWFGRGTGKHPSEIPNSLAQASCAGCGQFKTLPMFRSRFQLRFERLGAKAETASATVPYFPLVKGSYRVTSRRPGSKTATFDTTFTVDENEARVTPQKGLAARSKYAVMLGCSFTYGIGEEDDETWPYYFGEAATGYHVYNLAYPGFGASDVLARIRKMDLGRFVKERGGLVTYTFMSHHFERSIGTSSVLRFEPNHAYFREGPDGQLVDGGTFGKSRPWLVRTYSFLASLPFMQYFRIRLPLRYSEADYRYFSELIDGMRKEVSRQLPGARFVVLFYPIDDAPDSAVIREHLKDDLDRLHISYLDYDPADLDRAVRHFPQFEYDGHPTPEALRVFGSRVAMDLGAAAAANARLPAAR